MGPMTDLNDPIGYALRVMGYAVADITAVADSDLAGLPAEEIDELLDRAELRTLENVAGNLDVVNISVGPRSESLGDLSRQVEALIRAKTERINARYGGERRLEGGAIDLDFQQKDTGSVFDILDLM